MRGATIGIHGAAGAVGSAAAFALALGGAERLVLADAAAGPLETQRLDLETLTAELPGLDVRTGDLAALAACDVVVACAGAPHRDGAPRSAFLRENAAILAPLAEALGARGDDCPDVLLVSNPVDVLTTWLQRRLGDRVRVLGHTLNDTLRLRVAVARARGCAATDVEAWSAGEHGPHAVPLLSHVAVRGRRVTLPPEQRAQVLSEVGGWYDRWQRLGTGRTTAAASAWGIATLVRALLRGDPRAWPVSVQLHGQYGLRDVCVTVPVVLRADGEAHVLEWDLADEERAGLAVAAAAVEAGCARLAEAVAAEEASCASC